MNATPALISRCPFHIRVQTRMGPCEAKAPKALKCADCFTNSFASHLCFWLMAELLPWKQKKMFMFMFFAREIFCARLVAYSQTNCIRHLHISHNATFLLPKTLQNLCFISPSYYSRPKRNKRQCLCTFLGCKQGVLWVMSKR